MAFYKYVFPDPTELLAYQEDVRGILTDSDTDRSAWNTSKIYYVTNPSSGNSSWWYYNKIVGDIGWKNKNDEEIKASRRIMYDSIKNKFYTLEFNESTSTYEKKIDPSQWRQLEWIPNYDKFDDYMKDFIKNWFNFPYLRPKDTEATIDPKTVSKYQWRVASSQKEEKDYIGYEFNHEDPKQAKAALKRALARAQLETYALPRDNNELMAFYHYVGDVTIGTGANEKKYHKYQFDLTLSNTYAAWSFNKKVELGTADFGSTAKVQQSYNHAEIAGFYFPLVVEETQQEFDELNFEQIITKTLACFDLGLLTTPVVEKGNAIYYEYNKFSGEWEESDELYYKKGNKMYNLKDWKNQEPQGTTCFPLIAPSHNFNDLAIYKPVKLVNW